MVKPRSRSDRYPVDHHTNVVGSSPRYRQPSSRGRHPLPFFPLPISHRSRFISISSTRCPAPAPNLHTSNHGLDAKTSYVNFRRFSDKIVLNRFKSGGLAVIKLNSLLQARVDSPTRFVSRLPFLFRFSFSDSPLWGN